jgi:FMN hydrolase / 5-amino-6-(5-phospho-D-ribitylamino)uracil phosphatase
LTPAIEVISFDLDDTLWELAPALIRAEQTLYAWLERHHPALTRQYSREALRQLRQELVQRQPALQHDLTALRHTGLKEAAVATGCPASLADAAMDLFLQHRSQVTLYDDVLPVLETLHHRYRLVALTNGNADIYRTTAGHLFDLSICSAQVGQSKPDAAMFQAVAQQTGVVPAAILHVGDSPEHDVRGAWLSGVCSAWINRNGLDWPYTDCRPDVIIRDLHELQDYLQNRPG